MDLGEWLSLLPLWGLFVLTFVICLVAVEGGAALAEQVARRKNQKEPEGPLGSLVGSVLGLLAFILAFTFGMTSSRFDSRRALVLEESNALGTAYLRADLLPPKQGLEIQRLLREYVDVRLGINPSNIADVMKRSGEVHEKLWAQARLLVPEPMDSELRALFVSALNEVIDLHQSRLSVGIQYRIPGTVWFAVYLLTALSMLAVGYQVGMSGVRRLRGTPVLAAAFSLVIVMIADIDRPGEGLMRVSQQPIADVQEMMKNHQP